MLLVLVSIFGSKRSKPTKSVDKTAAKKAAQTYTRTYSQHTPHSCQSCGSGSVGSALLLDLDTALYSWRAQQPHES